MSQRFDQRCNLAMAITVEIGAALATISGPAVASAYLFENGAPPNVTARIVTGRLRGAGAMPAASAGRP